MEVVDLTEKREDRLARRVVNDQRGYALLVQGHGGCQTYRLRLCWSRSRPSKRHWHHEVRLADGRWWSGRGMFLIAPTGSS